MLPDDLPDISSFAGPLYLIFIVIEVALLTWARTKGRVRGQYETRDAATSMLMGLGNVAVPLLLTGGIYAGFYAGLVWLHQYAIFAIPLTLWAFVLCFLLDDLRYYWVHRLSHEIRWAWANHVVHHSSQHYNLSTALRQPWFSFTTGLFVLRVPLVLIGFHPGLIAFCGSLNLFYQFFIHTEAVGRLPRWVEAVFNTPSHHRVHHGKNPRYLDANYAGVLIVWDKLFGTYVPEDDAEPVSYGLVRDIGTFNPVRVAVHEYVAMGRDASARGLTLRERAGYLFGRPGWSHDGRRMTSVEIKRAAAGAGGREQRADAAGGPLVSG